VTYTTALLTWTLWALRAIWSQIFQAAPGLMIGPPTYRLISAPFVPNANTQWSDLTEATYSGYAAYNSLLLLPVNVGSAAVGMIEAARFIVGTASPQITNDIFGYALTVTVDSVVTLIGAEAFPTPIGMNLPGDYLELVSTAPVGSLQPT